MATTVTFADKLHAALDDQGISVRELARRLNPENPEAARSGIHKWLANKHEPHRASRRAVAVALGLEPNHFNGDAPFRAGNN